MYNLTAINWSNPVTALATSNEILLFGLFDEVFLIALFIILYSGFQFFDFGTSRSMIYASFPIAIFATLFLFMGLTGELSVYICWIIYGISILIKIFNKD